MSKLLTVLSIAVVIFFMALAIFNLKEHQDTIELKSKEIKTLQTSIEKERQTAQERVEELEKAKRDKDATLKEKERIEREKQSEIERLERELQAKLERKESERLAAAQVIEPQVAAAHTESISGNKQTWLAASGIPQHEWQYVDSIVQGESGWDASAVNPTSGACGLGQQLPCGKWAGAWNDPVMALRAMHIYVQEYGGWAAAYEFRNCTGACYSARAGSVVYKDHTWY